MNVFDILQSPFILPARSKETGMAGIKPYLHLSCKEKNSALDLLKKTGRFWQASILASTEAGIMPETEEKTKLCVARFV